MFEYGSLLAGITNEIVITSPPPYTKFWLLILQMFNYITAVTIFLHTE
jgi:hypothetical protein